MTSPVPLPVLTAGTSFDDAARAVLAYVRVALPMTFWSVTRVENGRQTYLYLDENGYGLPQGGSHAWDESFCIHMAAGRAPALAPDAQSVPAYAAAGVNAAVQIGAYAGAVISEPDGAVFGALCGLDAGTRTDDGAFRAAGPVLQLLGQLLTMVLASERAREAAAREIALARFEADTDPLTGLNNRRGWERLLEQESARFARFGDPTVVVMIDLDQLKLINDLQGHEAGDDYIRRAGDALRSAVEPGDVLARLGGDEFGLLMHRCTHAEAASKVARLYESLDEAGVAGSVGWAPISVLRGMSAAIAEADDAMYDAKRSRRSLRAVGTLPPAQAARAS